MSVKTAYDFNTTRWSTHTKYETKTTFPVFFEFKDVDYHTIRRTLKTLSTRLAFLEAHSSKQTAGRFDPSNLIGFEKLGETLLVATEKFVSDSQRWLMRLEIRNFCSGFVALYRQSDKKKFVLSSFEAGELARAMKEEFAKLKSTKNRPWESIDFYNNSNYLITDGFRFRVILDKTDNQMKLCIFQRATPWHISGDENPHFFAVTLETTSYWIAFLLFTIYR